MRSVLSKVQLSALALGLVVGGVVACGDDEPAPQGNNNPGPVGDGDGNTGGDGDGNGDGDSTGQPQCTGFGQACTSDTGESGFQACTSGVLGVCTPVSFDLPDGGFNLGDASIPTADCTSPLVCTTDGIVGQVSAIVPNGGAGLCTDATSKVPVACTDTATCQGLGLTAAVCLDLAALDSNGFLVIGAGVFGFPAKFCAQSCDP